MAVDVFCQYRFVDLLQTTQIPDDIVQVEKLSFG